MLAEPIKFQTQDITTASNEEQNELSADTLQHDQI